MKQSSFLTLFSSKFFLLFIICLLSFLHHDAQKRNVFAIVVGISNYDDEGIDKLRFAHRDAECFSNFLRSDAGGKVPQENITLLLNDQATWTAMYDAMDKVREECKAGDLVYFFFSGHGDVENEKVYKQGYLISYNTPRFNYTNRALRIMDLNEFANTLSTIQKARVVIITDACHSGSLTTQGVSGRFLAASQLKEVVANEIRLTSCRPDQLSMEDEAWGGGRSVFSYYLLNGLMGLADHDDGSVTLDEMDNYLSLSLSKDPVLKSRKFIQTPQVEGAGKTILAVVDKATSEKLKKTMDISAIDTSKFKPLPKTNSFYFFEQLKDSTVDSKINYTQLSTMEAAQIPKEIVTQMALIAPSSSPVMDKLIQEFESNPDVIKRFQKKLVDAVVSSTSSIIRLYEEGDEAELEKRRYYNSLRNSYDTYVHKLTIALKLTPVHSLEYNNILLQSLYFRSVALRLNMYHVEEESPLLDSAFRLMKQALLIEENAAYLHQEMGIIYQRKKDLVHAKEEYLKAIQISPKWALPYRNLSIIYGQENNTDKGLSLLAMCDSLQPEISTNSVFKGILYAKRKNILAAEENYHKAIYLNSRHYIPFEKLGFLYTHTTEYALADSFFFESEIRKKGFHFHPADNEEADGIPDFFDLTSGYLPPCQLPEKLNNNDVMGFFTKAREYDKQGDIASAKTWYLKTLDIQRNNPLVYHYLGSLYYNQKDDAKASHYFLWAQTYYLNEKDFQVHIEANRANITTDTACVRDYYDHSYYNKLDDYYWAGQSFERWMHYSEALLQYRQIVKLEPKEPGGYYKLWSLQDSMKHYQDEESTLHHFMEQADEEGGHNELAAFYRRVTLANPKSGEWFYKAGCYHYVMGIGYELSEYETESAGPHKEGHQPQLPEENKVFGLLLPTGKRISVLNKKMELSGKPASPHARAIWYLEKATDLLTDDNMLANAYEKLGDLYMELHSTLKAASYYTEALNRYPENAALREKLIAAQKTDYILQAATAHMDTLWREGRLSYDYSIYYATNLMKSGRFLRADSVLTWYREVFPLNDTVYALSQIRLNYLSEHWKETTEACRQFQNTFGYRGEVNYTMARAACKQENMKQAYEELQKAIEHGFHYYWILKYDPVWEKVRGQDKWNKITSMVLPPAFPSDE